MANGPFGDSPHQDRGCLQSKAPTSRGCWITRTQPVFGDGYLSVVDLATMSHSEHEDQDLSVVDLIDDSVVSRSDSPLAGTAH